MCTLYYGEVMKAWIFSHADFYYIPLTVTFPSFGTFLTTMFSFPAS
jgi:hypothetical protein